MLSTIKEIRQGDLVFRVPTGFFSEWYIEYGRHFPWREPSVTPFGIVLAEFLLKQTRAEMVVDIWSSLIKRYPSSRELKSADPDELFPIIAGLGFGHQRTKALLHLASAVELAGGLPSNAEDLLKLPHVGIYTAHAVMCFGFNQRVPVVDLNVIRVFSRLAGVNPAKDIRRASEYWDAARVLLPERRAVEHNYGLLDFGAMVCKSRSSKHSECPIAAYCAYNNEVMPSEQISSME